ncbi:MULTISPECIES: hypothetical protein [unclassified Streptomyces]|uniref:hypothetical protein n=1 Tax=unclassified Streptomyces TaxID=2593676 RepID=UPI0037ABF9B4
MPRKASLARKAQELADALRAQEGRDGDAAIDFSPHPETEALLMRRGVDREQLNYAVPEELELKRRLNAYNVERGGPGVGNLVAAVLDAFLRAEGYAPDPSHGK